jgi:acyl-CoA synthetase (AMP-forming)/AMP-acid ligase II
MSFDQMLDHNARHAAAAAALRTGERVISHGELAQRVGGLAAGLLTLGLAPGDRVAVMLRNCPELIELFLAAALSNMVLVPLNYRLAEAEIRWILEDVEPSAIVLGPGFEAVADTIATLTFSPAVIGLEGARLGPDSIELERLSAGVELDRHARTPDPAAAVMISYTGGTTGVPKGVVLTQGGFLASIRQEIAGLDLHSETLLAAMPLFHIGIVHALAVLSLGGNVILLERVDLPEICEQIDRHRVTMTVLLPTSVADMLKLRGHDLSSLRRLLYGGAPMPVHAAALASERFGHVLIGVYGLTESGGVASALLGPDHVGGEPGAELPRVWSVGRALPGVEIEACDPGSGASLATGEEGEIVIRTGAAMSGYWRRPDLTAGALRGGRLYTGDIGFVDHRGYLFLRDRKSNMIITGGENVYPREVEDALLAHPDVVEAGVVGLPHARWGEAVTAYVAMRAGSVHSEDALIQFCRDRLAGYKCPKRIVFLGELPRSVVGKVDKRALKALDAAGGLDGH